MRISLNERDDHEAPLCDEHGFPMLLIDADPAYRQASWECPVEGCRRTRHTGPSEDDIRRRELGW